MGTPERPTVCEADASTIDIDGNPLVTYRPMTDDEFAQWEFDQANPPDDPLPNSPPLTRERIATALAAVRKAPPKDAYEIALAILNQED